jgi:K(+)-stimulated pyrophosphate-energized sodium pump
LVKVLQLGQRYLPLLQYFSAYAQQANIEGIKYFRSLYFNRCIIGGTVPFVISALTMRSVSDAAMKMVMEVRRQFKEIPGIMAGTAQPDYERCVAISTKASLKEMVLPGC